MKRIPDEELEYYAELFIERRIREQGVTFERFLELPEAYLSRSASPKRYFTFLPFVLCGAGVFFSACGKAPSADLTAFRFVDQYYVKADLSRAKTLTDGLATRTIEQVGSDWRITNFSDFDS